MRKSGWEINNTSLLIIGLIALSTGIRPVLAAPAEFDCLIEPNEIIELSSPVPGILERINVDKSDLVRKGEVLAELKSDVEMANVEVARAKATFNGDIESRKASLDYASRRQMRTQQLFEKKAISFDQKDESVTQARVARMALKQAREQKKIAGLELQRAERLLELRTIRSPIDGIVIDRAISPGAYVKTAPLLKIVKVDPLRVETFVPTTLFNKVHTGMRAEILPEAPMEGAFPAIVTIVDKIIDAASGTFSIRLEMPNKENKIPAGLKCKLRFIVDQPDVSSEEVAVNDLLLPDTFIGQLK